MKKNSLPRASRGGFTFIEILVVTTIIAVLMAVGAVNFRTANQKARDGKRQGDLEEVRAALELYRTEVGSYPLSLTFGGSLSQGGTTYMEEVPNDPLDDYTYYYSSDGASYGLCASLELDTTGTCAGASCGTGITCNYQVENPL
ncbi:MAG: Type II secretion system protein G [Candidatus Beckwithbacteria bacterium GW2011_GWB1_47_15]|uniref:Type II secretion system protein G n=1 Tax=Candidatus Beckwithbacteria bacterium GW2011_GWB1_47_15 TaxID=1618371 RepID=A0A0G1UUI0_9BACT|nr:MAG: type II secretion system protein G, general secretion pathway protein G [Candidatus Beckwithbacteria bacterium GW2011_GWC1_49_16]KKU35285.1 MAG: Type II secretion system protein G [Candidatus Beckwithbacteria bacterium GW2011_GWA1_46_30]KKU61380.1 MAG: Type II secretion system protein G [Candidatus Beckwithbacteria bacterium GW2011_GWB1_47_15]KKU71787.1 MAG: Type II secretion system protein G [Candidatus Beckwithbacteria bacterium GW2011_GWA2_47_25]KKW03020.1 MAG: Type II secretion syst